MNRRLIFVAIIGFFALNLLQSQTKLVVPNGHTSTIKDIALTPDERYLITSSNGQMALFEHATGRQLYEVGYRGENFHISKDGSRVVSSTENEAFVTEIVSGRKIGQINATQSRFYFTNDGAILGLKTDTINVYDADNYRLLKQVKIAGDHLTFSPEKGLIAHTNNNKLDLLQYPGKDAVKNNAEWKVTKKFVGFFSNVQGVFSNDGSLVAIAPLGACEAATRVSCLETTGKQRFSFHLPTQIGIEAELTITDLFFSKDQKNLVAVAEGAFQFDALTGKLTYLHQPDAPLLQGAAGKNGEIIGALYDLNCISRFEVASEKETLRYGLPNILSWDNGLMIAKKQNALIWNQGEPFQLMTFRLKPFGFVNSTPDFVASSYGDAGMVFHPEKNWMLANTVSDLKVLDTKTGQILATVPFSFIAGMFWLPNDRIGVINFEGKSGSIQANTGKYTILDLKGKIIQTIPMPTINWFQVAASPDGKWIAISMLDNNIGIFNGKDGKKAFDIPTESPDFFSSGVFNADGSRFYYCADHIFYEYDMTTKKPLFEMPMEHKEGKRAGTGYIKNNVEINEFLITDDKKTYSYQVGKGVLVPINGQRDASIQPIGKDMAMSGGRIFNQKTGEDVGTLYAFKNPEDWVVVTPDGRFDGSQTGIEKLYFERDLSIYPLSVLFDQFYTPNLMSRLLDGEKIPPPSVDLNKLKSRPTVKIDAPTDAGQRNLVVEEDNVRTYNTASEKIILQIEGRSSDDQISNIRMYHNGKLLGGNARNLMVDDNRATAIENRKIEVVLTVGENHFSAVSINSQGTESAPDEIRVIYAKDGQGKPNPSNAKPQLWVVVVGINQYKNTKYNLNYAVPDAEAFKNELEKDAKGLFSKTNTFFVKDAIATKSGIIEALDKVKLGAKGDDVLIFYYAGHGVIDNANNFYLVPHDVTQLYGDDGALAQKGLSSNLLQTYSKDIAAQKQLFMLDACQSAGALNVVAARGAAEEKALRQLARSTGTHWLTAAGSEQFASEFTQLGHGTFTYALLEALSGKADVGQDGQITVKEISAYLQKVVPELTQKYKGTPQYPSSYGYGNDFPIGVPLQKR
jgi:WD40 repeat protein